MPLRREVLLTIAAVMVAGCAGPSDPVYGDSFDETSQGAGSDATNQIKFLDVQVTGENRDDDRFQEANVKVTAHGDSRYASLEYTGRLDLAVMQHLPETDCSPETVRTVHDETHNVTRQQTEADYAPGLTVLMDDWIFVDGGDYTVMATLAHGNSTWEDADRYRHSDEHKEYLDGGRDDSANITGIRVNTYTQNQDADAAREARLLITGTRGGSYESCRFTGKVTVGLERQEGDFSDHTYHHVATFEFGVNHTEFEGSVAPDYEFVLQDQYLEEDEWYRITVTAEVPARQESFETTDIYWHYQF